MKKKKEKSKHITAKILLAVAGAVCTPIIINEVTKFIDKQAQAKPTKVEIDVDSDDFGPEIIPTEKTESEGENTNG